MAILFFDDFRGYSAANLTQAWQQVFAAAPTFNAAGGLGPNGSAYISTTTANQQRGLYLNVFAASATLTVGFHLTHLTSLGASANTILQLRDAGSVQIDLRVNADGTFSITRNGTALTDGTSTNSISVGAWNWIELKTTIANSIGAGTTTLTVDGVTWITVATGQDTQATSNASVNQVVIGKLGSNVAGGDVAFANFVITNGTTLLGDCTVDTLYVNGNGTTQDFDPSSGSDHSLLVDETSGDGDTDYVSTTVATERELFTMSNLAVTPSTIHAVSVWNSVRKDDAGVKKYESTLRSGGTNYDSSEKSATDSYLYDTPIWETDPATASAWSASGVNAIEAGIQVTV